MILRAAALGSDLKERGFGRNAEVEVNSADIAGSTVDERRFSAALEAEMIPGLLAPDVWIHQP